MGQGVSLAISESFKWDKGLVLLFNKVSKKDQGVSLAVLECFKWDKGLVLLFQKVSNGTRG